MPSPLPRQRWDIFCRVIDNYGDIAVCWRLARQLLADYGCAVRLWVDDLATFARLCPDIDAGKAVQPCAGIEVRRWALEFPATDVADLADVADVVIEAFACDLPPPYLAAMARRAEPPCWINLEYLSAEPWVAECNGLPSPHPQLALVKRFFIPGFDAQSAGLLRERDVMARHAAFDAPAWWAKNGAAPADGALSVSLFAYENPALGDLFALWQSGATPLRAMLTASQIADSAAAVWQTPLPPGSIERRGALEVRALPFLDHAAYDDLLAACAVNFVRGEDSLVRAIWAGRPFVWHIYRQEDGAHLAKLDALLARYAAQMAPAAAAALGAFWHAWNAGRVSRRQWDDFAAALPEIATGTRRLRDQLAALPDLAANLRAAAAGKL